MITVLCYDKCTTCQKALKWLDDNNVKYLKRPIKEEHPNKNEIMNWHKISGLDLKKFFNTSGLIYRSMNLSEKLKDMPIDKQYELLASDGMLVKRPLLISDKGICPGFKEETWKQLVK